MSSCGKGALLANEGMNKGGAAGKVELSGAETAKTETGKAEAEKAEAEKAKAEKAKAEKAKAEKAKAEKAKAEKAKAEKAKAEKAKAEKAEAGKTKVGKAQVTKAEEAQKLVTEECTRIGNKLSSVTVKSCLDSHFSDSGARSVKGQAILIKEYPPLLEKRKPIGRVLLLGGTHGDEYSSVSVVFKWMQTLDEHHSGLFHWHVSPLLNPDGLLLSTPSVRLNANGVDLNRNMPTPDWYKKTAIYWHETGKDPRRYPGTAPLSEPESSWLYEEIRSFKPDVIISVHAPYGLLDFDGPPDAPNKIGQLHLKLLGAYPGSLGNSAGNQHHIPVITVELPSAGAMPSQDEISSMWMDLVRWMRHNIPKPITESAYHDFEQTSAALLASPRLSDEEAAEIEAMPFTVNRPSSMVSVNSSELN